MFEYLRRTNSISFKVCNRKNYFIRRTDILVEMGSQGEQLWECNRDPEFNSNNTPKYDYEFENMV